MDAPEPEPKRQRRDVLTTVSSALTSPFQRLCDDLVVSILTSLASRSSSPSHLISATLTCKRFRELGSRREVMSQVSKGGLAVRASAWSENAQKFLQQCADIGNAEACFTLGMIQFYCIEERQAGLTLLVRAAMVAHSAALFSLAIIQFNASGVNAKEKNAKAGVTLCAQAALAGSVDAMRELGHCLNDGQGLAKNAAGGRRLLVEANRKEAALFLDAERKQTKRGGCVAAGACCQCRHLGSRNAWIHQLLRRSLLSDFGCTFPAPWPLQSVHPVHHFLSDWFHLRPPAPGLRLCSHALCGRAESRQHEFRQCSACATAFYCSRSCQTLDWKLRHMLVCSLPSLMP